MSQRAKPVESQPTTQRSRSRHSVSTEAAPLSPTCSARPARKSRSVRRAPSGVVLRSTDECTPAEDDRHGDGRIRSHHAELTLQTRNDIAMTGSQSMMLVRDNRKEHHGCNTSSVLDRCRCRYSRHDRDSRRTPFNTTRTCNTVADVYM